MIYTMPKRLLIETKMNALSLCEGVQPKHSGCLGTLSGPCADYKNPTRNGNFYSRKLWENVFNDPLVKESLEDRVLLGELDHPGDRLETKATNAAIVMTKYDFDDQNGTLTGTFDILDTPNGRILKSLLDYGCKIGVSSRGEGDVVNTEEPNMNVIDEDSYYFVGFDAVCLPAVKKAKPSLQESLKRESLKESLKTQIQDSTTKGELDLIKKVVEATELPEIDSLLESIDTKSKSLEGINNSSNLLEDLEQSTQQLQSVLKENKELKREVTNSKSRTKRFIESRLKVTEKLNDQVSKNEKLVQENKSLLFSNSAIINKLHFSEDKVQSLLTESTKLAQEVERISKESEDYQSQVMHLEESVSRLQEMLRTKSLHITDLTTEVSDLKNDLTVANESISKYKSKVKSLTNRASKSLTEGKTASYNLLKEYVCRRSQSSGIDPKVVLSSITDQSTIEDIDNIINEEINRRDRYQKMSITTDNFINSLSNSTIQFNSGIPENDDDKTTRSFMEQVYHIKN